MKASEKKELKKKETERPEGVVRMTQNTNSVKGKTTLGEEEKKPERPGTAN